MSAYVIRLKGPIGFFGTNQTRYLGHVFGLVAWVGKRDATRYDTRRAAKTAAQHDVGAHLRAAVLTVKK